MDVQTKKSNLLLSAWLFVILQGLATGIAAGNIWAGTTCDNTYYSCSKSFNMGIFFGTLVGTVLFYVPYILILRGILLVSETIDKKMKIISAADIAK